MPEPRLRPRMQDQPMLLPPDMGELVPRRLDAARRGHARAPRRQVDARGALPGGRRCRPRPADGARGGAARLRVGHLLVEEDRPACGMRRPGHDTTSRFRTERMRPVFEEAFPEAICMLADMGLVTLDAYFLDGAKIEANANGLALVWAKSTRGYEERLGARVHAHLAAMDEMEDEEEALAPEGPAETGSTAVAGAARRINERMKEKRAGRRPRDAQGKALRAARRMLGGEWAGRMGRHGRQGEIPAGRGSHPKTGRGATFMRMEEGSPTDRAEPGHDVRAGTSSTSPAAEGPAAPPA